jgi:hypothetical protein
MALVGFGAAETVVGTGSSWVGYILMTKNIRVDKTHENTSVD